MESVKHTFKKDRYTRARGGSSQFLDIHCAVCDSWICLYQKDGPGSLLRMYLDRIFEPRELAQLAQKVRTQGDIPVLKCPKCNSIVATSMVYALENRFAYRLARGAVHKKQSDGTYPPPQQQQESSMAGTIEQLMTNTGRSLVCCGLDPDLTKLPPEILKMSGSDENKVRRFMTGIIDVTHAHVCAYKAQKAMFDVFPGGHDLLKEVIAYVHQVAPGVPVILDCKIGDIENTMAAYTYNIFDLLEADGVVINPYLGEDVITPLMNYPDKAIVVLAKTSNPGGAVVQDLILAEGMPLWEKVLRMTVGEWNLAGNMVPVVSSTAGMDMYHVRSLIPDDMPILLAGVGAQGGTGEDLSLLLNSQRKGVFVNSSRGLLYPKRKSGETWQDATLRVTLELKHSLDAQR